MLRFLMLASQALRLLLYFHGQLGTNVKFSVLMPEQRPILNYQPAVTLPVSVSQTMRYSSGLNTPNKDQPAVTLPVSVSQTMRYSSGLNTPNKDQPAVTLPVSVSQTMRYSSGLNTPNKDQPAPFVFALLSFLLA